MSGRGMAIDRPRRLPIQVPLRPGESPDSFIRRLAIANHLRPSYLRTYLNDPSGQIGSIQAWRLAAVTGRTVEELSRVLPGLEPAAAARPAARIRPDLRPRTPPDLHIQLHSAALRDEEVKWLSQQFGVRRATIIQALTGQVPSARFEHRQPQRSPILRDVTDYLDQLIAADPDATILSIWKKLSQDRQTTVCYGTIRNYVNRVRAQPADTTTVQHLMSRADLFARIRDEASDPDLVARLAAQFPVDRATVTQVLTGQAPPRAKRQQSQHNPILDELRHHIDEMVSADPTATIANIWERLVDHHQAEVSYATVRDYIARERRPPRPRARPETVVSAARFGTSRATRTSTTHGAQ
jgi:hypothetical protein